MDAAGRQLSHMFWTHILLLRLIHGDVRDLYVKDLVLSSPPIYLLACIQNTDYSFDELCFPLFLPLFTWADAVEDSLYSPIPS